MKALSESVKKVFLQFHFIFINRILYIIQINKLYNIYMIYIYIDRDR